MSETQQSDVVIDHLVGWAEGRDEVRVVLLTSTHAVPDAKVDALSDYDVILVVRDIHPFATERSWLADFGTVLIAYWDPLHPDPDTGIECASNVVQYADGLKIDFTIWPVAILEQLLSAAALPKELDAGYRVLLDKDGLAANLREPTHTAYISARPDEATYLTLVNDFFVGAPYVAKCLLRDEILPAKWCLDYDMRHVYLLPMLEWRMACDHDWAVPTGALGKGLKRRLPPDLWAEFEATFAGAVLEDNWDALFRMIALFGRVAGEVGAHLGYTYPEAFARRVTEFVWRMYRNGGAGG